MDVLDRRLSKKPQPAGLVAKKVRKIGTPSDCTPPNDAPAWALAKDNGMFHFIMDMCRLLLPIYLGNKENNETRGKLSECTSL